MKYRIGLVDNGPSLHAWVFDLPGVVVGGKSLREIEVMLPVVIAEHLAWLRNHDERVEEVEGWEIVDRHDPRGSTSAGGEFCFAVDRELLPQHELDQFVTRMEFARADLLDEIATLPEALLDWTPAIALEVGLRDTIEWFRKLVC